MPTLSTFLLGRFNATERKKIRAYQTVFDREIPAVNLVLRDLALKGHVFESTFSEDVNEMLLAEGERNCVLRILTILNLSPEEILELSHEDEQQEVTDV